MPEDNLESLQVVRYEDGQHYTYHTDTIEEYNDLPCGGRLASALIYLNEGYKGGNTHFLELDISVEPQQGAALVWYNCELPFTSVPSLTTTTSGGMVPNLRLAHAGMPVVDGGNERRKYAANKWVHANRYK